MISSLSTSDIRFVCSICQREFHRKAHLKRHQSTHAAYEARPTCPTCKKVFVRTDTLRKHERTHQNSSTTLLSSGMRACLPCAAAKVGCGDVRPCTRCKTRAIACISPPQTRFRQQAQQDINSTSPDDGIAASNTNTYLITSQDVSSDALPSSSNVDPPPESQYQAPDSENDLVTPFDPVFNPDFWDPGTWTSLNWLPSTETFDSSHGACSIPAQHDSSSAYVENLASSTPHLRPSELLYCPQHMYLPHEQITLVPGFPMPLGNNSLFSLTPTTNFRVSNRDSEPCSDRAAVAACPSIEQNHYDLQFHEMLEYHEDDVSVNVLSQYIYDQLKQHHQVLCVNCTVFTPFVGDNFPGISQLQYLIRLFFTRFHDTLPFLDLSRLYDTSTHWLLILAVIAIGGHYHSHVFATSMQEFLRRCIFAVEEGLMLDRIETIQMMQVRVLHVIGSGYLGDSSLFRSAIRTLSDLIIFANCQWTPTHIGIDIDSTTPWRQWAQAEEMLRLGYTIWLLDCMWSYQHNRPASLSLEHALHMPMPARSGVWNSQNEHDWRTGMDKDSQGSRSSFLQLLQHLYMKKSLDTKTDDFGRLLLVHAICHQTWAVQRVTHQSCSHLDPEARLFGPWFNNWRNSACDCLDILHYATIASDGPIGVESPNVAHLHTVRIILLSPMYHIVRLASFLVGNATGTPLPANPEAAAIDRNLIRKWINQDDVKARQAVVHAGMLFWNTKRNATNSFYEPTAVSFATLVLWAFSAFSHSNRPCDHEHASTASHDGQLQSSTHTEQRSDDECDPDVILLDRPTDKELVEIFIRRGRNMQAFVQGVGDLSDARAPRRVLRVGNRVLRTLKAWQGSTHGWCAILDGLANVQLLTDPP